MASTSNKDRSEIAFFDMEVTGSGQNITILEFGAILVCPRKLTELDNYSTLIRPADPSLVSSFSDDINYHDIVSSPTFRDIADKVYDILDGRIWAGHDILDFDCSLIREAFEEIGQLAPEPKGAIDSLPLLTQRFERRAGDMRIATLATYFGLEQPKQRSLDNVRMNLEVLKHCATVLFLEESSKMSSMGAVYEGYSDWEGFLEPDEISISSISASFLPFYRASQRNEEVIDRIQCPTQKLQLRCTRLKVKVGISTRFLDHAGRPRLSFVVDASQSLCRALDECDGIAQKLFLESGSSSEWRAVVNREDGFFNYPIVRLRIPTAKSGDNSIYETEIYKKESSGTVQRIEFSKFDPTELDTLFIPGTFVDAFFSVDPFDYQQNAGIRLVAKKLILH